MSEWEVWDEDDEIAGDEEVVEEDEEIVEEDEIVVKEDEIVVAKPEGDPAEEYARDYINYIPRIGQESKWLEIVQNYRQYVTLAEECEKRGMPSRAKIYRKLAKKYADLAFFNCPYRPHRCPIYDIHIPHCPVNMEKTCRPRAWGRWLKKRSVRRSRSR